MKTLKFTEAEMDTLASTIENHIRARTIQLADAKRMGLPATEVARHQKTISAQQDLLRKIRGVR